MDSWQTIGGLDWLCPDGSAETPAQSALGVVLAHGYADESPAELGIGAAAAFALARELARPKETPDHRVVELAVATEVNLQDTVILMTGSSEALRLGALALDELLRDPGTLPVPSLPSPRRFAWTGWTNELSAWLGMGSAALAAETEGQWAGDQEAFHGFLRRLHPSHGRPGVAWTTDPGLVGAAFTTPPDSGSARGRPLSWREPSPTAQQPGTVTATFTNNLLSARLPATRANEVAFRLVARTMHRSLVEFTQLVAGLQFTVEQIGTDTLYAVRGVPHERPTDWSAVRTALLEALDASVAFPDAILSEELEKATSPESMSVDLNLPGRALDAMRSGSRPSPAELWAEFEALTVQRLRDGTQLVQTNSLLGMPLSQVAPSGRPRRQPPVLPPVERPYLNRRSLVRLPQSAGTAQQVVRATQTTLQQTLTPTTRLLARKTPDPQPPDLQRPEPRTTAVDLTNVVARFDEGDAWSTLVDRENRRVTLAWPTYLRAAPLRAVVDAATPAPTRIALPTDPALTADLRARINKWRTGLILQLLVVALVVVLLIWQPVTGRDYQQPVVTVVPIGTSVTLGNGSTIKVSGARWRLAESRGRQYVVAVVRYCGGGVTVDRKTAADARNYVTPERFGISGIAPASRPFLPLTSGEVPLHATELAQGQCAEGTIGFEVDAAKPPSGTKISYYNGSGDNIQWSVN